MHRSASRLPRIFAIENTKVSACPRSCDVGQPDADGVPDPQVVDHDAPRALALDGQGIDDNARRPAGSVDDLDDVQRVLASAVDDGLAHVEAPAPPGRPRGAG